MTPRIFSRPRTGTHTTERVWILVMESNRGANRLSSETFGTTNGSPLFTTQPAIDRKSTRLNSSHSQISYAVFCLEKKLTKTDQKKALYTVDKWITQYDTISAH